MTVLSCILGAIVLAYTVCYAVVRTLPIVRFYKNKRKSTMRTLTGYVAEKVADENRAINGEMVNICLPKIKYEHNGKPCYYQSVVKRKGVATGQEVTLELCERTGEAWAMEDIPQMKKDVIVRVSTMIVILLVLLVTEILL